MPYDRYLLSFLYSVLSAHTFLSCVTSQESGVFLHAEAAQNDGRQTQEGPATRMHAVGSTTACHLVQERRENRGNHDTCSSNLDTECHVFPVSKSAPSGEWWWLVGFSKAVNKTLTKEYFFKFIFYRYLNSVTYF